MTNGTGYTFYGNQLETFFIAGLPEILFPDGLVPGRTYYWRIDEVNDTDPNSPWKGDVWSFMIPPRTAYNPNPADAAELVDPDVQLIWLAGFDGKLHTVYFGDNFYDVNNAAGGPPQGASTYSPGPLKLAQTYYWRVDEFDAVETHKGDVWSFTTQGAVVHVDEYDAGSQVELDQGQVLIVTLESNPTTGYRWEVVETLDSILEHIGLAEFQPSDTVEPPLVGAGGWEIFRFKAISAGQMTLQLVYHRPWEENVEPLKTFSCEVVVR
ncbi:hypothetical protein ES703_97765 [subsurface metagenome]